MDKQDKLTLRSAFRGYRRLTPALLKTLQSFDLMVISDRNHYKIKRMDGIGGNVTLSKTASDWRSGLNVSTQLIRLLEA